MRTRTRLARWAVLCGVLAACADGSVEPTIVRDESPVAMDSSTYHLLPDGAAGSETNAFSGTATFRNVTTRILYVADDCFGPAMHLERAGGDIVPMDAPICVDDAPPPGPEPQRTAIAPGDSIRVPFGFPTAQRSCAGAGGGDHRRGSARFRRRSTRVW